MVTVLKYIHENIKRLSDEFKSIVIRIPLIPGVNDSKEDIKNFASIINLFGDGIKGVELLQYNYLAKSKYDALGMEYCDFGSQTQSEEKIKELYDLLGFVKNQ